MSPVATSGGRFLVLIRILEALFCILGNGKSVLCFVWITTKIRVFAAII